MAIGNILSSIGSALSGGLGQQQIAPFTPGIVEDIQVRSLPQLQQQGAPAAADQAAPAVAQTQQRPRRSMMQWVGEIGDALAVAGQGEPIYRQRQQEIQQQQLAAQKLDQERLGMVMQGYQSAIANGVPPEQAQAMLPALMQQANMTPEYAGRIQEFISTNPQGVDALAAFGGAEAPKSGLNVQYATDGSGNVIAYTTNSAGRTNVLRLPEGFRPTLPLQMVNAGDRTAPVDRITGAVQGSPIQHGVRPDTELTNRTRLEQIAQNAEIARERIASSERIAEGRNETSLETARIRAENSGQGRSNQKASPAEVAQAAVPIVAGLRDAATRLYQTGGMTSDATSPLGVVGAEARERLPFWERFSSPEGYSARQDINRLTTVGIPALLPLLGGLTIGGKNIDAAKELETWKNAIMNAKDYPSAMRAVEGFESRITELLDQADAGSVPARNGSSARRRTGGSTTRNRPTIIRARSGTGQSAAPTVSNW